VVSQAAGRSIVSEAESGSEALENRSQASCTTSSASASDPVIL
jgi:hypothetical protein